MMHEWLFLLPVPPPPLKDMAEDVQWAECSEKPLQGGELNQLEEAQPTTEAHV